MKYKIILIFTAISCMFATALAEKRLSNKELKHINDSICHETDADRGVRTPTWDTTQTKLSHTLLN